MAYAPDRVSTGDTVCIGAGVYSGQTCIHELWGRPYQPIRLETDTLAKHTVDGVGCVRPQGSGCDIGAYESTALSMIIDVPKAGKKGCHVRSIRLALQRLG